MREIIKPVINRSVMAVALALPGLSVQAQVKPPVAQFWMDVATVNMSVPGMADMEDAGLGGLGGMLGGVFGTTKLGFGTPGKWLDSALHTRNKPAGTEGTHAIPPAMAMGTSLPLIPVERTAGPRKEREPDEWEKPKGKLLFYWGCGDKVRAGQPRVIDFSKAGPDEWGRFMTGRFAPDRGAKAVPGRSVWPNERDRQRVPKQASLVGDHAVGGEGVPASLRFAVREGHDFMPRIEMSAAGDAKDSVMVAWQPLAAAQGYFLTAMGARGEDEMIIWSSSEQPDPGWGLMDYLAPAKVKQLVGEKVVLAPNVERCAMPAGIFGDAEGAMVRMIAYGPELNLAHPPRPANAKAPWEPEWAVRVRVKSTGMTMLGMDEQHGGRGRTTREEAAPAQQEGGSGLGGLNPLNVIKGIFGR
ncbi:MAG: hypothetical protein IPJ52_02300 [Rhodocyclaceae bacterium]|nr:hypothetical protein [Rhodocyclaceae bacterium]